MNKLEDIRSLIYELDDLDSKIRAESPKNIAYINRDGNIKIRSEFMNDAEKEMVVDIIIEWDKKRYDPILRHIKLEKLIIEDKIKIMLK